MPNVLLSRRLPSRAGPRRRGADCFAVSGYRLSKRASPLMWCTRSATPCSQPVRSAAIASNSGTYGLMSRTGVPSSRSTPVISSVRPSTASRRTAETDRIGVSRRSGGEDAALGVVQKWDHAESARGASMQVRKDSGCSRPARAHVLGAPTAVGVRASPSSREIVDLNRDESTPTVISSNPSRARARAACPPAQCIPAINPWA
jgi:hypothetical protein